jgi:predicted phosphodiesterase
MRFLLLSDTHNLHHALDPLPDADAVLHAGDLTGRGSLSELADFMAWFAALPHRHKVVIAGNHDFAFERKPVEAVAMVPPGVTYLQDGGTEIEGLKIWGSPWQPWFMDWAFNLERGSRLAEKWALIPDDVDVLITHGPPQGILDRTADNPPEAAGCEALADRLGALQRLRLHLFGHIHEAYGRVTRGRRTFVNASICDLQYVPRNPPVLVDL